MLVLYDLVNKVKYDSDVMASLVLSWSLVSNCFIVLIARSPNAPFSVPTSHPKD